jgi:hypothetical protein
MVWNYIYKYIHVQQIKTIKILMPTLPTMYCIKGFGFYSHMQLATRNLQLIESRITTILTSRAGDVETQIQKANYKQKLFVQHWGRLLGVSDFKFECTPEEWAYVSMPRDAMYIHEVIAQALEGEECKVFIDAFACVGGDTVAAMNQYRGAQIFAVQKNTTSDEKERFDRLTHNVNFLEENIPGRRFPVNLNGVDIKTFITSLTPAQEVSVLYLDPPWALGQDPHTYSNPVVLNHFLGSNVWTPLREKGIRPFLIVLKLPGKPTYPLIESWPDVGIRYGQVALIAPSKKFAVYILRRLDPR